MSLSFNDVPGFDEVKAQARKAEIVRFAELMEADRWAHQTMEHLKGAAPHEVITFAAGLYYVVLITDEPVEATDGAKHNS